MSDVIFEKTTEGSKRVRSVALTWVVIIWLASMLFSGGVTIANFASKDSQVALRNELIKADNAVRLEGQAERNELRKEMNAKFDTIIKLLSEKEKR